MKWPNNNLLTTYLFTNLFEDITQVIIKYTFNTMFFGMLQI